MKIQRPYIIDLEASGLGSASYPIEVGFVLGDEEKFCSLIKPAPDWSFWDPQAEATHGISRALLQECGTPVREVAAQLNQRLAGLTLYSDGWIVDKPWLTKLFYAAGLEMKFHVSPLELILSEDQMEKWHATKDKIIAENQLIRHRASTDAWLIQQTYLLTQTPDI